MTFMVGCDKRLLLYQNCFLDQVSFLWENPIIMFTTSWKVAPKCLLHNTTQTLNSWLFFFCLSNYRRCCKVKMTLWHSWLIILSANFNYCSSINNSAELHYDQVKALLSKYGNSDPGQQITFTPLTPVSYFCCIVFLFCSFHFYHRLITKYNTYYVG